MAHTVSFADKPASTPFTPTSELRQRLIGANIKKEEVDAMFATMDKIRSLANGKGFETLLFRSMAETVTGADVILDDMGITRDGMLNFTYGNMPICCTGSISIISE